MDEKLLSLFDGELKLSFDCEARERWSQSEADEEFMLMNTFT